MRKLFRWTNFLVGVNGICIQTRIDVVVDWVVDADADKVVEINEDADADADADEDEDEDADGDDGLQV